MMKNYNIPAPMWLRIFRDAWNILGTAMITYLQAFNLPDHTDSIITATIVFIGSLVTVACIVTGTNPKPEEHGRQDNSGENQTDSSKPEGGID